MIILKLGDNLPIVGVLQRLLALHGEPNSPLARSSQPAPSQIFLDGQFGRQTLQHVLEFQRQQGLPPTGRVDVTSWSRLIGSRRAGIASCLDCVDPATARLSANNARIESLKLQPLGTSGVGLSAIVPISLGEGLKELRQRIEVEFSRLGSIVLLRFFGHGRPGTMAVGIGTGANSTLGDSYRGSGLGGLATAREAADFGRQRSDRAISVHNWSSVVEHLGGMRYIFHRAGSVELHGCHVAGSERRGGGEGLDLMRRLADLLGVPVTAAVATQMPGSTEMDLRFEGRTTTICPNNSSLAAWAQNYCSQFC